jgi:cysteine desulfurase
MAASGTRIAYLDNNANTLAPAEVIDEMITWTNRGNPSREMMASFREELAAACGITLEGSDGFTILLTSGASESNCHILTVAARSYTRKTNRLPHIVVSTIEHKSIILCCNQLLEDKVIQLTMVDPETTGERIGSIDPEKVGDAIRENTCLVCVMAANNETGIKNDVKAIAAIAHAHKVPMFSDCVQTFGKYPTQANDIGLDAFSMTFHKLHGPLGSGCLFIRNTFMTGYGLCSYICGMQNGGMRGGTENIPAIAGSRKALELMQIDRKKKTARMSALKSALYKSLIKSYESHTLDSYRKMYSDNKIEPDHTVIVFITPNNSDRALENTLMFAAYRPKLCNKNLQNELEKLNVLVGVGSACNTKNAKASHVLTALDLPDALKWKVLRVSVGDNNKPNDIEQFLNAFDIAINSPNSLQIEKK